MLKLSSLDLAIERVRSRVTQGGHDVPIQDIKRRFNRSWINFQNVYKELADTWSIFDTSEATPVVIEEKGTKI